MSYSIYKLNLSIDLKISNQMLYLKLERLVKYIKYASGKTRPTKLNLANEIPGDLFMFAVKCKSIKKLYCKKHTAN